MATTPSIRDAATFALSCEGQPFDLRAEAHTPHISRRLSWNSERGLALALGCGLAAVTLTVSAMLAPTAMEASHRYGEAALLVAMCLAVRR